MENKIDKAIRAIHEGRKWECNVTQNNPYVWRTKLANLECDFEDIRFALSERPSVAAYGESQMGKSYLISAILSDPQKPFCVSDGNKEYDFINEINPSAPDAQNEATGVVTRFTRRKLNDISQKDWLKVRLLSVADIVLVLAEAWYNEVIRNSQNVNDILSDIDEHIQNIHLQSCQNPLLDEVDLAYIDKYMQDSDSSSGFDTIKSSNLIPFLRRNVGNISIEDTMSLLQLFWNDNTDFNRLFRELLKTYQMIDYQQEGYVNFKSILRKHGTLLDVERLSEMFSQPSERVGAEYVGTATFRFGKEKQTQVLSKPFLSALVAELNVNIESNSYDSERAFLDYFDILDFPGLKPKDERAENVLGIGDNLAVVFRRGKVTYLFKKYSRTKRISSLLFCHNHNDSSACKMGPVLTQWVNTNVGVNPDIRKQTESDLGKSPLLIVSTWFNKNLEYNDEQPDADLNTRWVRRFDVLANQVLKSKDQPLHWFNSWNEKDAPFRTIFLLRSFKFSKTIFPGYDPQSHAPERQPENAPRNFPDYLERLKESFVRNRFVQARFDSPSLLWDGCATPNNDGTKTIISHLNALAPNALAARQKKFERDCNNLISDLYKLLNSEYHNDDPVEQTKQSKKEVGKIIARIDHQCGINPYYWSNLLESMMIPERIVRETVFRQINGNVVIRPMSKPESEIFMGAGLDTGVSAEDNLRRLCEYLGADDRDECTEILKDINPEIDINRLLEHNRMVESPAEQLLFSIEQLWQTDFLGVKVVGSNGSSELNIIVAKLIALYRELNVHKVLTQEIQHIKDSIVQQKQVGIVSNWLTMSLNKFVSDFGYEYIDQEALQGIAKKNSEFNLNIDMDLLETPALGYGIELLRRMDTVQHRLEQDGFTSEVREQQKLLPQYRTRWQWQNRMRAAFAILSGLRDYSIEANNELKGIIDLISTN